MSDKEKQELINYKINQIHEKVEKIFSWMDGEKGVIATQASHGTSIKWLRWIVGILVLGTVGIAYAALKGVLVP